MKVFRASLITGIPSPQGDTAQKKKPINSVMCNGGFSHHKEEPREENDYYATDQTAVVALMNREHFREDIWECAVGGGHVADILKEFGHRVRCSDIIDRGYPGTEVIDFFSVRDPNTYDIVTNPPYKCGKEFIEHALDISENGVKVAMFLKLTFLEGKARKKMFEKYPPKTVWVFSERKTTAKGGEFERYKNAKAIAYAWFVWEKGYIGDTVVKWI